MQPPGERSLSLSPAQRTSLWTAAVEAVERYMAQVEQHPVMPPVDLAALRDRLHRWTFDGPRPPQEVLQYVVDEMQAGQLHTAHPAYYGVFNPRASTAGVVGDMLAAAFNTQLASFTSAPFAIETEQWVLRQFATRFGYTEFDGCFTGGGAEANHTALLCALTARFPTFAIEGAGTIRPALYLSTEAHHSFLKAARLSGLGAHAVHEIPVDSHFQMDVKALERQINTDREAGWQPFMVVATLGSTSGGTVDPVAAIAAVAQVEKLWLHIDGAWGGAAVVLDELRDLFVGCDRSDSMTLDAHKWLSVPMTAGLFLTRHPGLLEGTFRVDRTPYMPADSARSDCFQPYAQTMQWSRRFIGLKLFMSLAMAGWEGYAETLRHQVKMGNLLRDMLIGDGWLVLNPTPLPVACFVDAVRDLPVEDFARRVAATGRTWITTTQLGGRPTLRAGISNYATGPEHLQTLLEVLRQCRQSTP